MFVIDIEFNLIVIEVLDFCIFVVENSGNILYVFDSVLFLLGYFFYELSGMSLFGYVYEDDILRFWMKFVFVYSGIDVEVVGGSNNFFICFKCGCFCM